MNASQIVVDNDYNKVATFIDVDDTSLLLVIADTLFNNAGK